VQFTPGGDWAKLAASMPATSASLAASLPSGPFVIALGGAFPHEAMGKLIGVSMQMMKQTPGMQLTDEQATRFTELSTRAMQTVRAMRMKLGSTDPGQGLYANSAVVMTVDDSIKYMKDYEATLAGLRDLAAETGSPVILRPTVRHVTIEGVDALEVSTDVSQMAAISTPGGPDMQKVMKAMFGPSSTLNLYMAAVDSHTIAMAYTSPDRLQAVIDFLRGKSPSLENDPGVAKVSRALPAGSQVQAYLSLSEAFKFAKHLLAATGAPNDFAASLDLDSSPPIGIAVKLTSQGLEGHMIVTAETLQSIGDAINKVRGVEGESPQG
jgi:hypothetical protein